MLAVLLFFCSLFFSNSFISMVLPPHITLLHPNTHWHTDHSVMVCDFLLCTHWLIVRGCSEEIGQPHYFCFSKSVDLIILYLQQSFDGQVIRGASVSHYMDTMDENLPCIAKQCVSSPVCFPPSLIYPHTVRNREAEERLNILHLCISPQICKSQYFFHQAHM